MTVWYEIKTLDGRTLSRTHGGAHWEWIVDTIKADAECAEDDIDIDETEEYGDIITVRGEHYARCRYKITS